jgi:hypothetical protein
MLKKSLLVSSFIFATSSAYTQTMIPKLDNEGRPGDVARQAKQQAIERFDVADENKDGKLSREEIGKHSHYLLEKFDERDKDKDGFLGWEEYVGHDRWPR